MRISDWSSDVCSSDLENDGEVLTVTGQFLDSVNVPPPGLLPELWAPVGLRYHALHHLLPGVPYHSLAEAHRRLKDALPADSQYHGPNYDSLPKLVMNLVAGSARGGAACSGPGFGRTAPRAGVARPPDRQKPTTAP